MSAAPRPPLSPASAAQNRAARPDVSAWVSANAGSGKTRVLTNRVARLLLAGADPARILCITYTKAAAAEMQARLFGTLGRWTLAPDADLDQALIALLDEDEPAPSAEARDAARRLFARALETPGGLKIQTIHAFCEGLLARFPFEAGVSPHSAVIDDVGARALRAEACDGAIIAARTEPTLAAAFARVFRRAGEHDIEAVLDDALRHRSAYAAAGAPDALGRFLGAPADDTAESVLTRWAADVAPTLASLNAAAIYDLATSTTDRKRLAVLVDAVRAEDPRAQLERLAAALLTQKGVPPSKPLLTKGLIGQTGDLVDRLLALQAGVITARDRLAAIERRDDSGALQSVADALIARYTALKAERAALDYDDLIEKAVLLLERAEARDWVRYKLDGGVEHILVDEAQDTSPTQWRVIAALASEFFAGDGVERRAGPETAAGAPPERTVFAVGDEKQSIYSFQGAAPEQLAAVGARFDAGAGAAARAFERPALATSFRSAPAILAFVDRVFSPPEAQDGLSFTGAPVRHAAHRAAAPGRVELWPLAERPEAPESPAWDAPIDAPAPASPVLRLAETVAETIAGWIGTEATPAAEGGWRRLRAGDVMVLVRKRGLLSKTIIKRLKQLGAPVAGDDRLRLLDALAVRDLIALGRFALLPEDDLTVATLLRAPFCDLSEETLFEIAHYRPAGRPLFYALQDRRADSPELARAYGFLAEALRRADFERPFDFYAGVLSRLGARAALTARLGPDAEDPIDEFLAMALRFEMAESPTLSGFLGYLAERNEEIKRETARGRDEVRILTVHGAKGLEAPVVFLPDTTSAPSGGRSLGLLDPSRLTPDAAERAGGPPPIWMASRDADSEALTALRDAHAAREAAEQRRLLYVAMTRAEDRLVIAGALPRGKTAPEGSWYALAAAATAGWGGPMDSPIRGEPMPEAEETPTHGWRLGGPSDASSGWTPWPEAPEVVAASADEGPADAGDPAPPAWLRTTTPPEPKPSDIAPSQLSGPRESAEDLETRAPGAGPPPPGVTDPALYGEAVHLLLERLPALSADERAPAGAALLAEAMAALPVDARDAALAEALGVLDGPDAAVLFGPGSHGEAPVTAILPTLGPGEIHGVIDRLIVSPDRVMIVDYKTGRRPERPPEPYLRQLAVYATALEPAFPDREITAALYWTRDRILAPLARDDLTAAFLRARAELDRRRAAS